MTHTHHTPGPWKVQSSEPHYHAILAPGIGWNCVASTWGRPHQGNANLIAAAPDLLQTLEIVLNVAEEEGLLATECDLIREVIAKARGEVDHTIAA